MKTLREDEKDVLQFANAQPLASIGRLFTAARSRIAEDALSRGVEKGVRQMVIMGAGLKSVLALTARIWALQNCMSLLLASGAIATEFAASKFLGKLMTSPEL